MARLRCTLIIVGLVFLVAAITAFRIRDLPPKSNTLTSSFSRKVNPLLNKCDDCDNESDDDRHIRTTKKIGLVNGRSNSKIQNPRKVFEVSDNDDSDEEDTIIKIKKNKPEDVSKLTSWRQNSFISFGKINTNKQVQEDIDETDDDDVDEKKRSADDDDKKLKGDTSDNDDNDNTEDEDDDDDDYDDDSDDDDDTPQIKISKITRDNDNIDDENDDDDNDSDDDDDDDTHQMKISKISSTKTKSQKIKSPSEGKSNLNAVKDAQHTKKSNKDARISIKTFQNKQSTYDQSDDDDNDDVDDEDDDEKHKTKAKKSSESETINTIAINVITKNIKSNKKDESKMKNDKSEINNKPMKKKQVEHKIPTNNLDSDLSDEEDFVKSKESKKNHPIVSNENKKGKNEKRPNDSKPQPVNEKTKTTQKTDSQSGKMKKPLDTETLTKVEKSEDGKKKIVAEENKKEGSEKLKLKQPVENHQEKNKTKSVKEVVKTNDKKTNTKESDMIQSIKVPKPEEKTRAPKLHLKPVLENPLNKVAQALDRKNLLASEFDDFYAFLPTFAPNFSRIHNPECRRHGQILLRQIRGTKLWALNMLDSTAKIPSGILQGNGNQLGDFDQCIESKAKVRLESGHVVKIQGMYCLAQIDVKAEHQELQMPVHLAQGKNFIKSKIDDPGHFIPRFTALNWGVCVPAACSPDDAEFVLRDALRHYQHTTGLQIKVKVDPVNCHTDTDDDWLEKWMEIPTLMTLGFYTVILFMVLVATLKDCLSRRKSSDEVESSENKEVAEDDGAIESNENEESKENEEAGSNKAGDGVVGAFSLYTNFGKLLAAGEEDEIPCVHGVRAISALALLFAHKLIPISSTPYTNRIQLTEWGSSVFSIILRASWVYTDAFLLLSGLLTANRLTADHEAGSMNWFRRLTSRYIRLTPALLATVLWYAYIWDNISTGPNWGTLVTRNAELCQESWWWNVLYLQNFFDFETMCATQTHQLALDMQLSLFAGILVWTLLEKPRPGYILFTVLTLGSAYARYSATEDHRLSLIIYQGISSSQLYRTARLTYVSIFHRCTPYLVGVALGVVLRKPRNHSKIVLSIGWLVSLGLSAMVWWPVTDAGSPGYRYDSSAAAMYAAVAPPACAIALAWLIYVTHNGSAGFFSMLLCSWPLAVVSRLSYAMYLVQFVIFFTNAATVRSATEISLTSLLDLREIVFILIASVVLSVTLVSPMQQVQKVIMSRSKSKSDEEDTKSETNSESQEKSELMEQQVEQEFIKDTLNLLPISNNRHIIAHRELLEEIPENEIEYETQRDRDDGLEEIMEEEEDGLEVVEEEPEDEEFVNELEVIEEEEGGVEDFWADREDEEILPRRSISINDDDEDLEEWECTSNQHMTGAKFRYGR